MLMIFTSTPLVDNSRYLFKLVFCKYTDYFLFFQKKRKHFLKKCLFLHKAKIVTFK